MIEKAFRWVMFYDVVSRVRCPSGHAFRMVETWSGEDCLVCDHKGPLGREDCGRRVYLAPLLRYRGKPMLMAVEVSAREMEDLKKLKTPDEILGYLTLKIDEGRAA